MKKVALALLVLFAAACGGDLSPRIRLFSAASPSLVTGDSTQLVFSVDLATSLTIDQGVGDVTGKSSVTVKPGATTTYTLTATFRDGSRVYRSTAATTVTVGHGAANKVTVENVSSEVAIEVPVPVTLTVRDAMGNPITDYAGTLRVTTTDAAAPAVPDVVFTPSMQGSATIGVTFFTDGIQSITAVDLGTSSIRGSAVTHVNHGAAVAYVLSALPSSAVAGTPMPLTISAVDRRSNLVTNYAGSVHVSSTDATDQLPADGGFVGGVRTVSLAFVRAGAHSATLSEVGGTLTATTASVNVTNGPAARVALQGLPASVAVDVASPVTATVRDSFGNAVVNYTGTVRFALTDTAAPAIPDVAFTAAMQGSTTVNVVFFTAGDFTLTATDTVSSSVSGSANSHVNHGAVAAYALSALPASGVAGVAMPLTIRAVDAHGNLVTNYAGTAHVASGDPTDQLPADGGFVGGVRTVSLTFFSAGPHSATVTEVAGTITATAGPVAIGHAPAARITLEGLPASIAAGAAATITVTVRDAFRNPVTDYAGTLHFVLSDAAAPPIADVAFTPTLSGTKDVSALFFTAGDQSVAVNDTVDPSLAGSTAIRVVHGTAFAYALSPLPASAIAGEPLPLTIRAVDAHGNAVTDYAGTAHVSSGDATDRLPADGPFTAGVRTVSMAFVTAAPHAAAVSEVAGTITANTTSVDVVSGDAVTLAITGGSPTAGASTSTTATAKDVFGNTVRSYAGTIAFSSTDGQAVLPGNFTFGGADAGQHTVAVTLKTAGAQRVTATDTVSAISGSGAFTVSPAAGSACVVSGLPANAAAGAQLGLRVTVQDSFGNVATGYTGTVALSSSDNTAQLSTPATFTSTDAGSRVFSAQLRAAGAQSVTATDAPNAIVCQSLVNVIPGAALFAVTFPAPDAWAGTAVTATVRAQDGFGNPITGFAGTIAFSTSDTAATPKPLPNVTLNGTEGGSTAVPVTFNTIGTQSLTATQVGAPATTGTGLQSVHGLVYTAPPAGGKVRLVANAVSNASLVQLDLVSNATLQTVRSTAVEAQLNCVATACSRRNGAFGVGMNLPLDINKVAADTTLITTTPPAGSTAVLTLGPAPQAVGALLNTTTAVLYSGISQKRAEVSGGVTTLRGDAPVAPFPGTSTFYYSLRLRLIPGAAVGTVFDGANLVTKFRAAVRDRSGSDVFSNPDFAIGKLEVR